MPTSLNHNQVTQLQVPGGPSAHRKRARAEGRGCFALPYTSSKGSCVRHLLNLNECMCKVRTQTISLMQRGRPKKRSVGCELYSAWHRRCAGCRGLRASSNSLHGVYMTPHAQVLMVFLELSSWMTSEMVGERRQGPGGVSHLC